MRTPLKKLPAQYSDLTQSCKAAGFFETSINSNNYTASHSKKHHLLFGSYPTQTRAVTGLLTGHNTLRRHLHLLGLLDSPMCRKCGVREETSAHILCECEALASPRHVYLGSFFLEPEDIRNLGLGAIWNFSKATGLT